MASKKTQTTAIELRNPNVLGITEASRTRSDLCEHTVRISWTARDRRQDACGRCPLLSFLCELFGQLLDPAFRRGKIVGGRSCHDYTRFPYNLPVRVRAASWRRLVN